MNDTHTDADLGSLLRTNDPRKLKSFLDSQLSAIRSELERKGMADQNIKALKLLEEFNASFMSIMTGYHRKDAMITNMIFITSIIGSLIIVPGLMLLPLLVSGLPALILIPIVIALPLALVGTLFGMDFLDRCLRKWNLESLEKKLKGLDAISQQISQLCAQEKAEIEQNTAALLAMKQHSGPDSSTPACAPLDATSGALVLFSSPSLQQTSVPNPDPVDCTDKSKQSLTMYPT